MLNYKDYEKLINICGEQFYFDNYELIMYWDKTRSELVDEIINNGSYGTNRKLIEEWVNVADAIGKSQFVSFPGLIPSEKIVFYDSHVASGNRDAYLYHLVEINLSKLIVLMSSTPKGYGLACWWPDSCCNVIPNVCLNGEIIRNNVEYSARPLSEIDEEIAKDSEDSLIDGYISSNIVLSDFIKEYNTIVIYFNAIYEYADLQGLNWEEVLFGVMSQEIFKAGHYCDLTEEFDNEDLWRYYREETSIGKMCTDVIDGMAQFYSYVMLDVYYGNSLFADRMKYRWRRNFTSDDPYAQALYFMYDGKYPYKDLASAIEKFNSVYDSMTIMKAFYEMRFGYAPVAISDVL